MAKFERIPYSSFLWKFGTTSFRTKEFNKMTEWQLRLLDEFWQKEENKNLGWEKAVPGQKDIYEIKNRYYDWLVENKFTKGNDKIKYKAAREKTSGLLDMGLINREHRLTEIGRKLIQLANNHEFIQKNELNISKDSQLYLEQLLKLSDDNTGSMVRPFIIVVFLLTELDYLSNDEFKYLTPLCTNNESTSYILQEIKYLRNGKGTIDSILKTALLNRENYKEGLERFVNNVFSEELLLSVGMNRKSANYDKPYINLYNELHAVYIEKKTTYIFPLLKTLKNFQPSIESKWKQLLFKTSTSKKIKDNPQKYLKILPKEFICSEKAFKTFFFLTMHLYKAKATLEDYLDLNKRYLGLTNCFLFEEGKIQLDIVPKLYFKSAIHALYKQAYTSCNLLFVNCPIDNICPELKFNKNSILKGINKELGSELKDIEEAYSEVDKLRYQRFNKIINTKFSNKQLLKLLNHFDAREDDEINKMVTENADVPTIFEYIIGIIWYNISGRKGKILDYLKLSLDANLLPITHAAGGEADIVYQYNKTKDYPSHSLLIEATLADSTNQRRMEMEPVSRHLGNHLLQTNNKYSYCIFATSYLHINVIGDFRNRKTIVYCDPKNAERYVEGMKIIPLSTDDLRNIINSNIQYETLYEHFDKAYNAEEKRPKPWYDSYVHIPTNIERNP